MKCRYGNLFFAVSIFIFVIIYNINFFNRYFPVCEGWYTSLAWAMNHGKILYTDIKWALPPLYSILFAEITDIFTYNIILFRYIGIFISCIMAILWYFILSMFFSKNISFFSSVLMIALFEDAPVYIGYDYYPIFFVFTQLSCLCMMKCVDYINNIYSYKYILILLVSGISAGMSIWIRQNSGFLCIICSFFLFLYILYLKIGIRKAICGIFPYCIGVGSVSVSMLIWMLAHDNFLDFFQQVIVQAPAGKGGMVVALFGWIKQIDFSISFLMIMRFIILFISIQLLFYLIKYINVYIRSIYNYVNANIYNIEYIGLFCNENVIFLFMRKIIIFFSGFYFFVISVFIVMYCGFYTDIVPFKMTFRIQKIVYTSIVVSVLLFIFLLIMVNKYKKINNKYNIILFRALIFFIFAISLTWGAGTSGVVHIWGSNFSVLFLFCMIFEFFYKKFPKFLYLLVFLFITVPIWNCAYSKSHNLYDWWGLSCGKLNEQKTSIDTPILSGLYTTPIQNIYINDILFKINKYTKKGDSMFIFPQIPIFYVLSDRNFFTSTILQWFDVCHDSWILEDINRLKLHNPDIFLLDEMDESIYIGHEVAYRNAKKSIQRLMLMEINNIITREGYILCGIYEISPSHKLKLWIHKRNVNDIHVI